jgi:hypothetical protein
MPAGIVNRKVSRDTDKYFITVPFSFKIDTFTLTVGVFTTLKLDWIVKNCADAAFFE